MEENRRIFIRKLCEALEKRGFVTSDPDLGGLVSFELIARREQEKYIIKILHNVDTFRISMLELMSCLSSFSSFVYTSIVEALPPS